MRLFADDLHDEFGSWALGLAPYGGGDVGEVVAVAAEVGDGDDGAFHDAWAALADRRVEEADAARAAGRRASARDAYMRAACFYAIAYHPLYGTPVDPRLRESFRKQMAAFDSAMALGDPPGEALAIPYEGTHMPGYLVRAAGREDEARPLLICGGGWDSTMTENHLAFGAAAAQRGYHVLLHDGPGQGRLLVEEGLPLRHDWEHVIAAVVDVAETIDGVDPSRIAYEAWSLGGYFAPRAASFEHRLAACVADPGQFDMLASIRGMGRGMGLSEEKVARLPELDDDDAERITAAIAGNRGLAWKMFKRGYWTNGADGIAAWFAEMARWSVADCAGQIRCPTLVTAADDDPAAAGAQALYDALECPKEMIRFTSRDGAGMHCEMLNRSLLNRRVFDWLDATFGR